MNPRPQLYESRALPLSYPGPLRQGGGTLASAARPQSTPKHTPKACLSTPPSRAVAGGRRQNRAVHYLLDGYNLAHWLARDDDLRPERPAPALGALRSLPGDAQEWTSTGTSGAPRP